MMTAYVWRCGVHHKVLGRAHGIIPQGDGNCPGGCRYLTAVDGVQRLQATLRDDYANELQVCRPCLVDSQAIPVLDEFSHGVLSLSDARRQRTHTPAIVSVHKHCR